MRLFFMWITKHCFKTYAVSCLSMTSTVITVITFWSCARRGPAPQSSFDSKMAWICERPGWALSQQMKWLVFLEIVRRFKTHQHITACVQTLPLRALCGVWRKAGQEGISGAFSSQRGLWTLKRGKHECPRGKLYFWLCSWPHWQSIHCLAN